MGRRSTATGFLLAGLLLAAAGTHAAQVSSSTDEVEAPPAVLVAAQPEEEELEEVLVRGTRLWQLRQALVEAEDRLYARYNELNTNDDFDIHCRREAPIGTRIMKRICRIAFFEEAQSEHARALVTGVGIAPHPDVVMMQRQDEFRANAIEVYKNDRRLRALSRELERLQKRYQEEHQRRFGKQR